MPQRQLENLTGVMSVKGNNSKEGKGVAQRWDVIGFIWDRQMSMPGLKNVVELVVWGR